MECLRVFNFLFLTFAIAFSNASFSSDYDSCCLCITGSTSILQSAKDKSGIIECKDWIKKNKNCTYKRTLSQTELYDFNKETGVSSCKNITLQNAYHGKSSTYHNTFFILNSLVKQSKPEKLTMDGSTCLMFNNLESVEKDVERLTLENPSVSFRLSGNQNSGVTARTAGSLYLNRVELDEASSKMTFIAQNGTVKTEFAACSKANKSCALDFEDFSAETDPNEKFCMQGTELVTQRCCQVKKNNPWGKWADPEKECNIKF